VHKIKITSITSIGEYLLARDVCPSRYLGDLGLPPSVLLGSSLWLDRDACLRIADNLGSATGDRFPGMHVAEMIDLRAYGLWSARILASKTVGEALHAAADRIDLIESGRLLRLTTQRDRVRLETGFLGDVGASPREYLDASVVLLSRFVRLATERIPFETHLAHERPADTSEIERLLGPNLVFDAEITALVLDREALATPMDRRKIERVASPAAKPEIAHWRTATAAARAVQEMASNGRPTIFAVAESLSMNVRTLQRHLAEWGITFEQLLDDLLFHYAMIELREAGRSVTDVAFDLGYSDSAHFTRAFKRWTGCTPRQFRSGDIAVPLGITPLPIGQKCHRQFSAGPV
jgi:AraC-like DNA-binding protein